jgi:hypothetical protein
MRLWIQDPCVIQQRWTPVPIKHGENWMQYEIIKNFSDDCQWGRRIRVDWLWTDIKKGGRPGKLQPPSRRGAFSTCIVLYSAIE